MLLAPVVVSIVDYKGLPELGKVDDATQVMLEPQRVGTGKIVQVEVPTSADFGKFSPSTQLSLYLLRYI